jgi:hypothetical protein
LIPIDFIIKHLEDSLPNIFSFMVYYQNTNSTLNALHTRGIKGLPGHKKVTQCLHSGNAAYAAHTPRNVVGT